MSIQISLELCLFVILINFIGFFIKGVAAFGDPLITNPLLAMKLDNKVISPANLCFNMPINAYIAWKNRENFSIREIAPVIACIICGVVPGTLLLKYATSWALKACLGLTILSIGIEMLTRSRAKPIKQNNFIMAPVCFCSGVTAGLYGINLFFVAYMERSANGREAFRGNICFVFFIENVIRIAVYAISGVYTRNVLLLVLIGTPGMLLGFLTGLMVDKKLSDKTIRGIVIALFMLSGASVLIKALIWHI